jgi:GGDEF domain-containing protein
VCGADGLVSNYVGNFTDMTQHKSTEDKIERLVSYNALTDLPNRRLMLNRLQRALTRSQRYSRHDALLFIDMETLIH